MFTKKNLLTGISIGLLIGIAGFFVFHNLGLQPLHPWDEAWYGVISRNMVRSGNWWDMYFNDKVYWDHPPLGFWLMSLSYVFFGFTEFATRFPQALLGVLSVVLMYGIGKKATKSHVLGFAGALMLLSSRWFLLRARTGNLDVLLVATQLLWLFSLFLIKSRISLRISWVLFGVMLLSKSAISIVLAPLMLLETYRYWRDDQFSWQFAVGLPFFSLAPLIPWYGPGFWVHGMPFLKRNIFVIGLRELSSEGASSGSISQTLLYLRAAANRWYRFFGLGVLGTAAWYGWQLLQKKWHVWVENKGIAIITVFTAFTMLPYFVSGQTEIWHLIPLLPALSLLFVTSIGVWVDQVLVIPHIKKYKAYVSQFLMASSLLAVIAIATWSMHGYWDEFLNHSKQEIHMASVVENIPDKRYPLYVADDTYFPSVVFYADHQFEIQPVSDESITEICLQYNHPFFLVTDKGFVKQFNGYTEIRHEGPHYLLSFEANECQVLQEPSVL